MTGTPPDRARWALIQQLYHEAAGKQPADRSGFLDRACAGDMALRGEIESLLRHEPHTDGIIDMPAIQLAAEALRHRAGEPAAVIGASVGAYRIVGVLGAGGMGEVYRAHDVRLGRDVAIKVLPPEFVNDPARLRRLDHEARVLASLSHPHIGAIYGLEEIDGMPALVLELIEGPTLEERLDKGALPIEEAVRVARQIADALEAAHAKGIIHRDLKPANVKVASGGQVKVLDFGIAKALARTSGEPAAADPVVAPTQDVTFTTAGSVLGTPGYMSPEQARGEAVDERTDVWAFGCVLFEMLTGRPPYRPAAGALTPEAHEQPPDWSELPGRTPPHVRRLLRRAVEPDVNRRLRNIGDARLELDDPDPAPVTTPAPRTGWRAAAMAALAVLIVAAAGVWWRPDRGASIAVVRFAIADPPGALFQSVPVPSPDGRQLVFAARTANGASALWIRALDSTDIRRLAGTEDVVSDPFWSPDGDSVGFSANGQLKRIDLRDGSVRTICEVNPAPLGASWGAGGEIVFSVSNKTGLYRVRASGGVPEPLTTVDESKQENSHRWPSFLPDGRRFLYTARSNDRQHTGIYVGSLDGSAAQWLFATESNAVFVRPDFVLYVRDHALLAHRVNPSSFAPTGEPAVVAADVMQDLAAVAGRFSASADGTVVAYAAESARAARLTWFDRLGQEVGIVDRPGVYSQLRLAPDGRQAAVVMADAQSGNRDIWTLSLDGGVLTRLTSDAADDWFPVWSPDSKEVLFASNRSLQNRFYRAPASGGSERAVFTAESGADVFPTDWTASGRAVFHSYPRGDVWMLPLAGGEAAKVIDSPFTDWVAAISPDERLVAYVSDETGSSEVYIRSLASGARVRVSQAGGGQPRWRRDGRELFFAAPDNTLMSAAVGSGGGVQVSAPKALFTACVPSALGGAWSPFMYRYDVSADGSRSVWLCPATPESAAAFVTVNWERALQDNR